MVFVVSNDNTTLKKYKSEESTDDIIIPGSFSSIGKEAFYESSVRSVIIEEGVSKIGSSAFCGCYKLESVTLPNSMEEIGYDAFGHCEKLKELILPTNLMKLGKAPFANCKFKIIVSEDNEFFKVVNEKLFSKDGKKLIYCPTSFKEKTYTVPKGTQTICELAFAWNEQITEIILPDGVKEIKGGAFASCSSLEKIVIPATVKKIELEFDIMETFDAMNSWYPQKRETFVIEAPKDSYAIEFAKEHNIKFKEN
ncbi:MAG: leucine-rich repeat domain-containing protein [Clostridia bacterium]|nr:leucine-rich repeat domain-containing protein [Clostridia bacterium]